MEVRDSAGLVQIKLDTFAESSVYSVGQSLDVLCNPQRGCIENTFGAKWADSLSEFLLALACFIPLLYFKLVRR